MEWTLIAFDGALGCIFWEFNSALPWYWHISNFIDFLLFAFSLSRPSFTSHFASAGETWVVWRERKNSFPHFPTHNFPSLARLQCLKAWLILRRNSTRVIQYFDKLNEMMHGYHGGKNVSGGEWMWKIWISHPFFPPLFYPLNEEAMSDWIYAGYRSFYFSSTNPSVKIEYSICCFSLQSGDGGWSEEKKGEKIHLNR